MQDMAKQVGARIREIRQRKKLTQEQVAERAAVNATYYGRVERGDANVSLKLLADISTAMEASLVELVDVGPARSPEAMASELVGAIRELPEKEVCRLYRMFPLLFQTSY
jgi:transcriptional regulator with XRE-family HTH domain